MAEDAKREMTRVTSKPQTTTAPPPKAPMKKASKPPASGREKIKTIVIIVLVVILVLEAIFFVIFIMGMSDMLDDESYFVCLETNGVFKAGTFWRKSDEHKITYDVEKLGAYTEQYSQQNFDTLSSDPVNTHGPLDRMMIWSSNAITELYGDGTINFHFEDITVDQLLNYINYEEPPSRYYQTDPITQELETTQDVRARMFNAWIDQYFGNTVNTISELPHVLDKIGDNKISLYPSNAAVTLLTIIPILSWMV
jgi:hypothetical protein